MEKRSSRLENSVHSWAKDVPDIANTRADDMSGIRRMIDLPRRGRIQFLNSTVDFNVLLSIPVESVTRT
jgi:hypothetical protein